MPKRRKNLTRARIEFLDFWIKFTEKYDDLTMTDFINLLNVQQQSMINSVLQFEWEEARRESRESESRGQEDDRGGSSS